MSFGLYLINDYKIVKIRTSYKLIRFTTYYRISSPIIAYMSNGFALLYVVILACFGENIFFYRSVQVIFYCHG